MKKFSISLVLFTSFALIIYSLLLLFHSALIPQIFGGNLFRYNRSSSFSYSRLREADQSGKVDILIIGSSHAYRGYDVRLFQNKGYKTLNLGTSQQSLIQTEYLLNKYLDKLQPSLVILDVYPDVLSIDGIEPMLELLTVSGLDQVMLPTALGSYDPRVYNTIICNSLSDFVFGKDRNMDLPGKENKYIPGGYVENSTVGKIGKVRASRSYFTQEQYTSLLNIRETLKRRNIRYHIFQSPVSKAKYASRSNNREIDKQISFFGDYSNFNKECVLPDSCFMDDNHINSKGVKKYNDYVFSKLF